MKETIKKGLKRMSFAAVAMCAALASQAQTFNFSTTKRGPLLGDHHYGIFYEEINHAGDGGLYAELIRNRSMEDNGGNPDFWWPLGNAAQSISTSTPMNKYQTKYMKLVLKGEGDGTRNEGFWGINVVKGTTYKVSFWMRTLDNWDGELRLTLEGYAQNSLGTTVLKAKQAPDTEWTKYTATITATGDDPYGWFAIRASKAGTIYLDMVSLFPPTFKNRENGMRKDVAEMLQNLHPTFMRFPGGCYIEGGNRYQWKNTVGPQEERWGLYNSHWGYPVCNGMGYHEFLQFCEDINADPLFVVNIGMGHGWMVDYQNVGDFIQEALDAIEYANGPVDSKWGSIRAKMGHPEPFNLRMIEIGNENYNNFLDNNDDQSDHYPERYYQFYKAIKEKYPYITCIGNINWSGDYPTWRNPYPVDIVDEHFYRWPDWFASMYHHYDGYSRTSHGVYCGEYAVTSDFGGGNGNLHTALGEAIFMAGMEVNSDVVKMSSYAPIFCNEGNGATQWVPDMIHLNSSASFGTPSYWAQQMMAAHVGYQNLTWTEEGNEWAAANEWAKRLYLCASINQKENEAIVKIVNYGGEAHDVTLQFDEAEISGNARSYIMSSASDMDQNTMAEPRKVVPVEGTVAKGSDVHKLPFRVKPFSLSVVHVPLKNVKSAIPSDVLAPQPVYSFDFNEGKTTDVSGKIKGEMKGGSRLLTLDDGNVALYTGRSTETGHLLVSSAKELAKLANTHNYSVSMNIMIQEPSNFGTYCWALALGTNDNNYTGIISTANNGNWYSETRKAGSYLTVRSGSGLSQNVWHNIVYTQQDKTGSIYVDGQLRGTVTAAENITLPESNALAYIARSFYSADAYMAGTWFDDVAFYDKALTHEEIAEGGILAATKAKSAESAECKSLYEAYDKLYTLRTEARQLDRTALSKAISSAETAIRNYKEERYDAAQAQALLDAATADLKAAMNDYRTRKMGDIEVGLRIDITSLLTNADFANGATGWKGTDFTAAPGTVAEQYWKVSDNYQTLPNMPAGTYELQIRGFYRNGGRDGAYLAHTSGDEELVAEYYLSTATDEASLPFMSLYDESTSYTYYNYPDNVGDADNAFNVRKFYLNEPVSLTLPEPATLTLGFRKNKYVPSDWVCFDDVRLYFIPSEATAIEKVDANTIKVGNLGVFDLQGRPVQSPTKGVNIVNGRKVLY